MALKKRQRLILGALIALGGEATTRQIAEQAGLHVNGVSQSLGALTWQAGVRYVKSLGGRGGDRKWKLEWKIADKATGDSHGKHDLPRS